MVDVAGSSTDARSMAYRGFEWVDAPDPALLAIGKTFAAHPRMTGYYILRRIDITAIRAHISSEDRMLDMIFEHFGGTTWPPFEERVALGSWADYAITAEAARTEIVGALVGGDDIGHLRDTMSRTVAEQTWAQFESLFAGDRAYFTGLGLGDRRYPYLRGIAIVDAAHAGYLGIVEGD